MHLQAPWFVGDDGLVYAIDGQSDDTDPTMVCTPTRSPDEAFTEFDLDNMEHIVRCVNAHANIRRYNEALNEAEISPNGDDYNALLDLMAGGAYSPPRASGR